MEEAYKAGRVRAIGVSNFYPDRYIDIFNNPVLKEIGANHGKSAAQVALRFLIKSGVVYDDGIKVET